MNGVDGGNNKKRRNSLENNIDGTRDPSNDNQSKAGSEASGFYRMPQYAIMVNVAEIKCKEDFVTATTRALMDAMRQSDPLAKKEANIQSVQRNTQPAAPK